MKFFFAATTFVILYCSNVAADIRNYMQSLNGSNAKANEKFIQTKFVLFGLDTWLEEVNYQNRKGSNVIGVLWGKKMLTGVSSGSTFYIVSSSYASSHNDRSGVAVMLDVAEKLTKSSKSCDRDQTIVFVAFDETEQASQQYLKNLSSFKRTYSFSPRALFSYQDIYGNMAGGVTIDEVSKYDTRNNTQQLPATYVDHNAELKQRLSHGNYKGDFVLAVGGDAEKTLLEEFKTSFLKTEAPNMYGISLQLPNDVLNSSMIQTSFKKKNHTMVVVTDTNENRNSSLPLNQENFSFMNTTSVALQIMLAKVIQQKCYSLDEDALRMYDIMKNFNLPRYRIADKNKTRIYIESKFKSSGLKIIKHNYANNSMNIAGVLEGCEDKTKVYIIASHYDTQQHTNGFDDSGSGVAVLIRVAQMLAKKIFNYSIMLIAFDDEEILGSEGSEVFVPKYLTSAGNATSGKYEVLGSWILDCTLNYNDQSFTQSIPPGVDQVFPEIIKMYKATNYTGNTLTAIGRYKDDSSGINDGVKNLNISGGVTAIKFNLPFSGSIDNLSPTIKAAFGNFFRSDHAAFWRNGITSVFLTDSSEFRGVMRHCYHRWCDTNVQYSPKAYTFASGISIGLASLLQEKAEICNKSRSASKITSANVILVTTTLLAYSYWINF